MKISYRAAGFLARVCARCAVAVLLFIAALPSGAAQLDIPGPAGSVKFGSWVTVLPNSNIVVTDPSAGSNAGAVYLYSSSGNLISSLTGSTANERVGDGGIIIVGNSNFLVVSSGWNNGAATSAGAVTWVSGTAGLNGVVSASNSLVGTTAGDEVGYDVTVLANGNYLVSSYWNNGVADGQFGAVTWGNGASGVKGAVSASNSLVGTTNGDLVGYDYVTILSDGNYVVATSSWNNGVTGSGFGAATWGNGSTGIVGPVSAANSLVGSTAGDYVGSSVVALSNGNYVVLSPSWNNGTPNSNYGAATWANGATGMTGAVAASNSLVGTTVGDKVANRATALSNGNYVVASSHWNNGVANANFGAATWGNGANGLVGTVSASNSLIGTTVGDQVAAAGVIALSNGNYVVDSPHWNNGTPNSNYGAATWGNGVSGAVGVVAAGNSLIGTTNSDSVASSGITALGNGNYVVTSPEWNNGVPNSHCGAATWGNGESGLAGAVSAANSLIGTTTSDRVGYYGASALANGNYVVASPFWNNATGNSHYGAVTWGSGTTGISGPVSAGNSLIGTTLYDQVGYTGYGGGVIALAGGNYVVGSPYWNGTGASYGYGAATWGNGTGGLSTAVAASNSLTGTTAGDGVGYRVKALGDGNYAVQSPYNGAIGGAGAVTLASGKFRLKGTIQPWNSVLGMATNGGGSMTFDYDAIRHRLVVGRPAENIVSLFTMDQIFVGDFDP